MGLANGFGAGTIQPLQAVALPNNGSAPSLPLSLSLSLSPPVSDSVVVSVSVYLGSAAQDMNLIISAFTIAQIFAPIGCGVILAALVPIDLLQEGAPFTYLPTHLAVTGTVI